MILILHVLALAFWFGVVGAEFFIERSRTANKAHGYEVARIHYWIDLFVEIPAFTLVLVTGFLMLDYTNVSMLYVAKVAAGLLAIGANAACVVPVILRKQAADRDDMAAVIRYSRGIDLLSIVGAPSALAALVIGVLISH